MKTKNGFSNELNSRIEKELDKKELNREAINFLMESDPSIRWQTMRDLLSLPKKEWLAERSRVRKEGWGSKLLDEMDQANFSWGGGAYSPKWTSTNYTMLQLVDMGLDSSYAPAKKAADNLIGILLGKSDSDEFHSNLKTMDLCIVGMLLGIGSYFRISDSRLKELGKHILEYRMKDCGWNCRIKNHKVQHSSFHTTINILEGLRKYINSGMCDFESALYDAEASALEFMLEHRLFKSDKTGEIVHKNFLKFSYPPRWYYDVLRGLDYFQSCNADYDCRLDDAMNILISKRKKTGLWFLQNNHPGKVYFPIEKPGKPGSWNTLRAMRIIKWYGIKAGIFNNKVFTF